MNEGDIDNYDDDDDDPFIHIPYSFGNNRSVNNNNKLEKQIIQKGQFNRERE